VPWAPEGFRSRYCSGTASPVALELDLHSRRPPQPSRSWALSSQTPPCRQDHFMGRIREWMS
jgi:hypothetical protein